MPGNGKSLLKVVVLGDAGVGKTSLVKQYVEHKFDEEYKPTIGADFLTKDMNLPGRGNITLQIWDTAGQERFKSMAVSFYRGADACVLCYDITDPKSFHNLEMWMQEFSDNAGTEIDQAKFPFIVLGNKADKGDSDRQIGKPRAEAWCKSKNNIPLFETSAVTKLNLDEAFDLVAQAAGRGESIPQGVALASVADLESKAEDDEKLEDEDAEPDDEEDKPTSKAVIKRKGGKKGRASQANASPRHKKKASRATRAPLPGSSEDESDTDSAGLHSERGGRGGRSDRPSRRASPNDDRSDRGGGRGGGRSRRNRSRRSVSPDGTIHLDDARSYYSDSSSRGDRRDQCCLQGFA